MMRQSLCCVFMALVLLAKEGHTDYYPTVFWTPTNCRFNLNNQTKNGYFMKVKAMGSMVFMCPHISIWAGKSDINPHRSMMHEKVLLVDEESYRSCTTKNSSTVKTILTCDGDPMGVDIKYVKEEFASIQTYRHKQCYRKGQHYYFVSMSDGSVESLNNTEGGHCKTHHMKLHIYVCNDSEPCEFEMPECPKETVPFVRQKDESHDETSPKSNCTDASVVVAAQAGVKGWFSDNRHPVYYALTGLIIVMLLVVILWLFHTNRKYRRLDATTAKSKKSEKESCIAKV